MPEFGCEYTDNYEKWLEENIGKNKEKEKTRRLVFHKFCDEIISKVPTKYYVDEIKFKLTLIDYFIHGSVDWKLVDENGQFNIFKMMLVKDGKTKFLNREIEDGVYIKIGPYSSLDSIKKYISKNAELVKSCQETFLQINNLPTSIKLHSNRHYKRDSIIEFFNLYTKQQLASFGATNAYKEGQIAFLMNRDWGYTGLDADTVKMAIYRRKKGKNSFLK